MCETHQRNQISVCKYDCYDCMLTKTHLPFFAEISVSLGQVLNFFSGAYTIPPCGYPGKKPTLKFNEDDVFPTASTCAIHLTLPTKYEDYETFKSKLDMAFTMHGGFGKS